MKNQIYGGQYAKERYKKKFSEHGLAMREMAKGQFHGVGGKTLEKPKLNKMSQGDFTVDYWLI